ncbi:MAG: alpha/beta hydrolase [Acidobacteriia bacterium]|nr:alpha/beta hydrolase [Terriglobia bacterium]
MLETLVLLPGLDGTGTLFAGLISELPPTMKVKIARYPTDRFFSYSELLPSVRGLVPSSDPFLLVAESFSTPLAAMLAATRPPNLVGLVMGAGFVRNPLGGWSNLARILARPFLFRLPPPGFALEYFLIGSDPPSALEAGVRQALGLVSPMVLSRRVHAVLNCDAREDLARTDLPMMYVQAEGDRLVHAECFVEIQRLRPDALLSSVRAPHLVFQREPQKVAKVIVQFIRQLPGSS